MLARVRRTLALTFRLIEYTQAGEVPFRILFCCFFFVMEWISSSQNGFGFRSVIGVTYTLPKRESFEIMSVFASLPPPLLSPHVQLLPE